MALCVVPLLWRRVDREFFLGKASIRATFDGLYWHSRVWGRGGGPGSVLQVYRHLAALGDLTTQALQSIQGAYGFWTTLALVAIFVPAIEEVLFRGVILQALSRYLSFRWLQYFRRHYLRVCTRRPKLCLCVLTGLTCRVASASDRRTARANAPARNQQRSGFAPFQLPRFA